VNKLYKLSLSNYPLTYQLFFLNLLISFVGFLSFIIFNLYLINNDKFIYKNNESIFYDLNNITNFLERNSIARVPLFDDSCNDLNQYNCSDDNYIDNQLELSDPELEPTIAQQFIIQNYLNRMFSIKIYNDNWIKLVDTKNVYLSSKVSEIEFSELSNNNLNFVEIYEDFYQDIFHKYHSNIIKKKYIQISEKEESDINIVQETIKSRKNIIKIYSNWNDNELFQVFSSPIINNDNVFGVVIISYPLIIKNEYLGSISFNLFNFFILFVLIMVLISFIFSRGLVRPIKQLSYLTTIERGKLNNKKNLDYPSRKDEIGILSKEIQAMSLDLKSQIDQIKKFSADVSHELKNPLTSIQSVSELIQDDKISNVNKKKLMNNLHNDVIRMNRLISDIANFTMIKAEIETDNYENLNIKNFLKEVSLNYLDNKKNIKIKTNKINNSLFVFATKDKLNRVFFNLIDNSISLAPENSTIFIEVEKFDDKQIQIKLYDQGEGIFIEDKDKVFERFYTDRNINKDKHTGLGLSIVREIITSFRGTILLAESDKDQYSGPCFIINLPLKAY